MKDQSSFINISMYTLTPVIQYLTSKIQYTDDILTLIYYPPLFFVFFFL